ncbi:hypothetical protein [Novosphingobium sp. JCM 18896]|uniref:hypothetical protein n=1 Tax=Novosphingobium sp. JCM 18896 TaxID=2989731 RepID=UPI002223B2CC|nr:hypothetical protein [Novosphingobium sp. JCM 18896]MCW1431110.1 hypothetical protein [Novosphingobium sp. JCM 18896]
MTVPTKSLVALVVAAATIGPLLHAQSGTSGLAGRWTQVSSGKELVLVPRIKLVPNVGVTPGTNLGGTVGYGSMTRTTVVTEPVMLDVARTMTLEIDAAGGFKWSISRRHQEKPGCTMNTNQVKHGRVSRAGATLAFAVVGGTETFNTSCGRSGSSALTNSTERYQVRETGRQLEIVSGASRWRFDRAV